VQELKDNKIIIGFSLIYIALSGYLVWTDLTFLVLAPIGLLAIYFAIFYTEYMYLGIAFLTPPSINIEEFT
jgi:1,4-dihydroxy-2-naphthoate octaprenyltransferase